MYSHELMWLYSVKNGCHEDKYWVMQIRLVFTFWVIKCNEYKFTGRKYTSTAPFYLAEKKMTEICRSPRDIYGSLVCFTKCHPQISWALISALVLMLGCLLYYFFPTLLWMAFLDRSILLIFHYPREKKKGRLNSGRSGAASETVQSVPKQLCC